MRERPAREVAPFRSSPSYPVLFFCTPPCAQCGGGTICLGLCFGALFCPETPLRCRPRPPATHTHPAAKRLWPLFVSSRGSAMRLAGSAVFSSFPDRSDPASPARPGPARKVGRHAAAKQLWPLFVNSRGAAISAVFSSFPDPSDPAKTTQSGPAGPGPQGRSTGPARPGELPGPPARPGSESAPLAAGAAGC